MANFKFDIPLSLKPSVLMAISAIFLTVVISMLSTTCYYDSEEYLYPDIGTSCDTVQVTFSQSVRTVLANNCLSCHSNNAAASFGGNIKLQDYADVKARADDGKLLGSITHAPGFIPMPVGTPKIDDCSIAMIRKWIDNGSMND